MPRCSANTKNGYQCANNARPGSRYCAVHRENMDWKRAALTAGGAIIGNVLMPGVGGFVLGGVGGNLLDRTILEEAIMKKKIFVSFDFDKDQFLKTAILAQAKHPDSPFEVVNWSLNEPAPERDWKEKARARIKRADIVLVLVGTHTHKAPGVLAEIAMAREERIPIVQVKGYADKECPPVSNAGRFYRWTWDNLKQLLG